MFEWFLGKTNFDPTSNDEVSKAVPVEIFNSFCWIITVDFFEQRLELPLHHIVVIFTGALFVWEYQSLFEE